MIRIYRKVVATGTGNLQDLACIEISDKGIIGEIDVPLDLAVEFLEDDGLDFIKWRTETDENGFQHNYKDYDIDDVFEILEEGVILELATYCLDKLK